MSIIVEKQKDIKITLPPDLVDKFGFESIDDIEFEATEGGILLKNKISVKVLTEIKRKMRERIGLAMNEMEVASRAGLIDRDQLYHWTPESQQGMKEAINHVKAGSTKRFNTLDDAIKCLKS